MTTLEKRFKIAALAILGNKRLECLEDKLDIIADSIDMKFPDANKMVDYLENSILTLCEIEMQ